jgi:Family of unknown function (DUF6295)
MTVCTGLVQRAKVDGAGKAPHGWFRLEELSVMYDCTYHTSMPMGVNIDFFNEKEGPSARVAVELSPRSAMELVHAIMESLFSAGIDPGEAALGPDAPVALDSRTQPDWAPRGKQAGAWVKDKEASGAMVSGVCDPSRISSRSSGSTTA